MSAVQLNQRNPKGVVKVSTVPLSSERVDTALYMVGWSGCHSEGLLIAGVVWSKVNDLPASICCWSRNRGDHLAVLVDDVGLQRGLDRGRAVVLHLGLDRHGAGRARVGGQRGGGDPGAVPGHVQRVGDHDEHVSVKTALEGVIAGDGRDLRVPVVVQANRHHVVAGLDGGGDVDGEPVVAADVLADLLAVDVDLRLIERRLEFERHVLARP